MARLKVGGECGKHTNTPSYSESPKDQVNLAHAGQCVVTARLLPVPDLAQLYLHRAAV